MSKILKFYRDKDNVFKYKLNIEGANLNESFSRLCLEFDDGFNIYIKSKINTKTGKCIGKLPPLKNMNEGTGTFKVETVAGKTFFKIYETKFILTDLIKVQIEGLNENDFVDEDEEVTFENESVTIELEELNKEHFVDEDEFLEEQKKYAKIKNENKLLVENGIPRPLTRNDIDENIIDEDEELQSFSKFMKRRR